MTLQNLVSHIEYKMHCEEKLKLRSHNTSYYLIEVVIKAGLTILSLIVNLCVNLLLSVVSQLYVSFFTMRYR
jgi:hypothetical protein